MGEEIGAGKSAPPITDRKKGLDSQNGKAEGIVSSTDLSSEVCQDFTHLSDPDWTSVIRDGFSLRHLDLGRLLENFILTLATLLKL